MDPCLPERRKLAEQPEVLSADEFKHLLTLTREHFLDQFDAVIPKTITRKTDKVNTSSPLNGKFLVTLNISYFLCVAFMTVTIYY